jgi:hypothetical protein
MTFPSNREMSTYGTPLFYELFAIYKPIKVNAHLLKIRKCYHECFRQMLYWYFTFDKSVKFRSFRVHLGVLYLRFLNASWLGNPLRGELHEKRYAAITELNIASRNSNRS